MAAVTLATVVDLTKIKMKWKEQYVSEGLNRKVIPSFPHGIYKGLKLVQNISSPRQVEVSVGADSVHSAVHQSNTGFSTTYYDNAGTSIILNLGSASLDNQETVITLSITYTIGTNTSANWIAYPIADWNALTDAQRRERIVLGTVNVPAPATNITTAMISPDRRTVAWENASPGAVAWSPVVKNPSFESSVSSSTSYYAIRDWILNSSSWSAGHEWRVGTSTVRSGAKSLEFNKTLVGAGSCTISQILEVPVVPGQLVNISGWVRQLIAPSAGSYQFALAWGDLDNAALSVTTVTASVLATTDASFRKVGQVVEVPAAAYSLKLVSISVNGVVTGSTGVALAVDDFQVYVETGSPQAIAAATNTRLEQKILHSLIFEDIASYSINQLASLFKFDKSTLASEGSLDLERKDLDYSGANLPPALNIKGRALLGNELIATEAKALKPRISAPVATAAGINWTLLWESVPSGLKGLRLYAGDISSVSVTNPSLFFTVNASFDGANWNRDVNGAESTGFLIGSTNNQRISYFYRASSLANSWAHNSGWSVTISLNPNLDINLDEAIPSTNALVQMNLSTSRQAFSLLMGTADILGVDHLDQHGRLHRSGVVVEEDFDGASLGKFQSQDFSGVGTITNNGNGKIVITTAATGFAHSIVRQNYLNYWDTSGGTRDLGFRARIKASTVDATTEQRFGFWLDEGGNPDSDARVTGFKIINGAVSLVWHDGGTQTLSTGLTVTSTEWRWYSFYYDSVQNQIFWHVSGANSNITSGYTGTYYGSSAASDIIDVDPGCLFVGVRETAGLAISSRTVEVDYISAWSSDRAMIP